MDWMKDPIGDQVAASVRAMLMRERRRRIRFDELGFGEGADVSSVVTEGESPPGPPGDPPNIGEPHDPGPGLVPYAQVMDVTAIGAPTLAASGGDRPSVELTEDAAGGPGGGIPDTGARQTVANVGAVYVEFVSTSEWDNQRGSVAVNSASQRMTIVSGSGLSDPRTLAFAVNNPYRNVRVGFEYHTALTTGLGVCVGTFALAAFTGYCAWAQSLGGGRSRWHLDRFDAGTRVNLDTDDDVAADVESGRLIELQRDGASVQLWRDGVLTIDETDATYGIGNIGVGDFSGASAIGAQLREFRAGNPL